MKFRSLNIQELEALRDDFVQFLAANSITAPDWTALKEKHPEKRQELVQLFSNIVWEKVISKTKYLEMRQAQAIRLFKFEDETAEMIQVVIANPEVDLREKDTLTDLAEGRIKLGELNPEVHTGKKKYSADKDAEIYYFLEKGATRIDQSLWDSFQSMIKNQG